MNLDNFEKGQWIYLCCCNYGCYNSTVGEGGKAAVGWLHECSHSRIPPCATCTGMEGKTMMINKMKVNDDALLLRDFLLK